MNFWLKVVVKFLNSRESPSSEKSLGQYLLVNMLHVTWVIWTSKFNETGTENFTMVFLSSAGEYRNSNLQKFNFVFILSKILVFD